MPYALAFVVAIAVAILMIKHQNHPIVKGTSLSFCLFILLGVILGLVNIAILFGKPTMAKCTTRAFISAWAFGIVMCNLLVKTYRIYRIFRTPFTLKRGELSTLRMMGITVLILVIEAIILGTVCAFFPLDVEIELQENEYGDRWLVCKQGLEIEGISLFCNLLYLIVGFILVYATRKIRSDQFGESGYIVLILLFDGVVVPGLALFSDLTGKGRQLLAATIWGVAAYLALAAIYFPKIYGILADETLSGEKFYSSADQMRYDSRHSVRFGRKTSVDQLGYEPPIKVFAEKGR